MRAAQGRRRKVRRIALVAASFVALALPANAFASFLWWTEDGSSFASFGPNASVTIDTGAINFVGTCAEGTEDVFFPFSDIYIVPAGSVSNGSTLTDAGNAKNTVQGVSGGLFVSEQIAFTKPTGSLGEGLYAVVYDECQDGKFGPEDSLFDPALQVTIPDAEIPQLPSILAIKSAAGAQADDWQQKLDIYNGIMSAIEAYELAQCLTNIASCAVGKLTDALKDAVKQSLGLKDPKAAALSAVVNTISRYRGIEADPPDPNFTQPTVLPPVAEIGGETDDPLLAAAYALGAAAANEAAIAEALLHAMERYQGADAAGDGEWALVQVRGVQQYAGALADQLAATNDALADFEDALAADTRPLDDVAAMSETVRARLESSGATAGERLALRNLGASDEAIDDAVAAAVAEPAAATKAGLIAAIGALGATNAAARGDYIGLHNDAVDIFNSLQAQAIVLKRSPYAVAGGPYTAAEGTAVALSGAGSVDPDGSIASYEWDLDGDGAFDDATGVSPSVTFDQPLSGVVGLRVTDDEGRTAVDYARADVTEANAGPSFSSSSPELAVELATTESQVFSVATTDPEGDAVTVQWFVGSTHVATGPSFTFPPSAAGIHVVRATATDGPLGGTTSLEWTVTVLAPDGDGDGWNGNVDCDDANDEVHPDNREVVLNGLDDDCDAGTPDTGSPPTASFSHVLEPGLLVTFSDTSADPNEDVTDWLWAFGDGTTSTEQSPIHLYAAKGTYSVTLTVTDATGQSSSVTREVGVSGLPTAAFSYAPPAPAEGGEVDFTDLSTDTDGTIASWAWSFGDGGTSAEQHPTHVYLGPGTFTVTLTVIDDDGAAGSTSQEIVIGVGDPLTAPVAQFSADVTGVNVASAPGGATVVAYSAYCCGGHEPWVMLDDVVGLPWAAPKSTPNNFASIQLIGTATAPRLIDTIQVQRRHDGCCPSQGITSFAVDVSTTGFAPADFTQVLTASVVENTLLQTFELPGPTLAKYVRYRPLTSPDGSWLSTGTFKVLSGSVGPRTVTFENHSTNAVSYRWEFGDGGTSTAASPTHTYATVGTYTVKLTAKAADGRTSTTSRVYEARGPTADFSVDPTAPEPGEAAVFADTSLAPSSPLAKYAWDFGDGTMSTSPATLHAFESAGTYEVSLTVTDGEGNADTVTKDVTVEAAAGALPKARFSPSSGGTNVAFSGSGATIHSYSSQYSASYPATTILDENPGNTYWATANGVRSGWVKIDLAGDLELVDRIRIAGDGGAERVQDFRVSVSATTADDAAFTEVLAATNPNDDTLREYVFPGGAVTARYVRVELLNNWGHSCCVAIDRLDVLTGPASPSGRNLALAEDGASIAAFSGNYDATNYPPTRLIDGDPASLPWLTPNGVTQGWVKITLSNDEPRMIDRIRLQPRQGGQRVKDFEVAVSTTGTADGDFLTVLSATAADNENLQTFLLPHPMPAKHLLYRVLTNRANGNYTGTGDIRVDTGQESRSPTVRFRNLSRNATSYAWDFGDGETSTDANPIHTYAAAGTYTVTLTATNANGSTTFTLEQVVRAPAISYTPVAPEAHEQVDFLDESPAELGLKSWTWDFGDGSAPNTFRHPVKTYGAPGTYTVTMTGIDREGVAHVATAEVEVSEPAFRAQFHPRGTFNMASLENGAAIVAFSSQYSDVANWGAPKLLDAYTTTAWHSSNSPPQSTKWMKFGLAGGATYQIDRFQLLGRQDCCHDQHPADFEIAVSTTGTDDADFKTVLRATLPAGRTTLQTFMLPRPVLAKYVLYRTLTNRGSGVVTTASLKALSGQVSTPTVTFDDLTVGGAAPLTYAWDFGDGETSADASPTHTFPGPGTYDVTLTVTDASGATSTTTLTQRILNAPVAAFTNAPATPNEAQATTFTDTTPSPADGPIVQRRWSWDDATAPTTSNGATTTHTFADDGKYDVQLDVVDAWGQTASVTKTVTVANVAPTADAGPDWRWREDRVLTTTPKTADVAGGRDPVTCTWAYGDGSAPSSGCAFSHTYAGTGTYTATLTASDGDGGVTTDSIEIEVIEQEVTGGGGGGSGSGGGTGVGKVAKDYVFTVDGDFELGTLLNVNHEAPGSDQLQLNKEAKPFPFVYIANSDRGTAVRIDVETGEILGEYRTAPNGRALNPSRTTVDKLGNVYVTNRNESERRTIDGIDTNWGSATRIGLLVGGTRSNADGTANPAGEYMAPPFEYNTCVDRDADGLIRTSRGLGNILAWTNTGGVDNDGGAETAVDECIQHYIRVRGINTRTVAIDSNNDAWIGGANNWHEKIDGDTGERVPGTAFSMGCGGYGGLIDGNDVLWSARYGSGLLRYDTKTRSGVCIGNGHGDYGLGVDPVTGHIWHTNLSGDRVVKLDQTKTTAATIEIARYPHGNANAQGVAVDAKGNVWVAHALFGATTIGRVRTDGTFLGTAYLGGGRGPTGVAVDANGKVWSANQNSSTATRVDPEIGQKIAAGAPSGWFDLTVNLGAGAGPYNYSDMTGAISVGAASPSGFWSIKQDATALGTIWRRISWDGSTPGGTSITVEARAADNQSALPSTPFVTVADGEALSGIVGRFIEVRATLQTSDPTTTPILTDIRISANTPPAATDISAETPRDTSVDVPLAATDEDGDELTYEVVDSPAHGTVTLAGNVATYLPSAGYTGPDSFTYRARDADGESNVATVTLQVLETNRAPVADDASVVTPEDTPLPIALPAIDPDGDGLTFATSTPSHGTYAGGIYTPDANYHGPDSFTYTATDPSGESDGGTISIEVTPVNDAPLADDQDVATDEDTPLPIELTGSDVDGDTLTFTVASPPEHGTFAGGVYTPAPNYHGPDSFTFVADDGHGAVDLGTVTIAVRPVNDAPIADDQHVATDEDTPLPIELTGSDVDGDTLTFTAASPPEHGTFAGGVYTPAPNYHGPDSFTFVADDGHGGSDSATVAITVRPVNDPPLADDLDVATDEDTPLPIELTGSDVDGDTLTFTVATPPEHGTYTAGVYTPDPNYHGPDSFTYTADDGHGGSDSATVSITVRPVNDAPLADDQDVATDEDTPLPIELTGSDAELDPLTFAVVGPPEHGTYAGGIYTPDANYFGPDELTFEARDGNGGTDTGVVTITVRPVNDPPTVLLAGPDAVDEGAAPVTLTATATDPDGDPSAFTFMWSAASGTVTGAGATAAYANDDGPRTDTVTVTVHDGDLGDTATLEIAVRNVAPTADAGPDVVAYWGLATLFAGVATDPSAADVAAGLSALWRFGDGSGATATTFSASHAYANPGTYTATLTATDKDGGAGEDTTSVLIEKRETALAYTGETTAVFGLRTLEATLSDEVDAATADLAGKTIVFRLGARVLTGVTDADGVATATAVLPLDSGELAVEFAGDSHYLPSAAQATLEIVNGPGQVTAGVLRSSNDGRGGFNVHSDGETVKGELQFHNDAGNFHAHELTELGLAPDGRSAWFAGTMRDGKRFVAYVEDNGEPGRTDVFKLWIAGRLQTPADGGLLGGNVQIHTS